MRGLGARLDMSALAGDECAISASGKWHIHSVSDPQPQPSSKIRITSSSPAR